MVVFQ